MRPVLVVAILALATTVAAQDCSCSSCNRNRNLPEVVTYGEPCFCKQALPYSVQVPKVQKSLGTSTSTFGGGRSYGYKVIETERPVPCVRYDLPIRVQTPVIRSNGGRVDTLSGRSYGVNVQEVSQPAPCARYSFDYAVQRPPPPPVQRNAGVDYSSDYTIEVRQQPEQQGDCRYAPLSFGVQKIINSASRSANGANGAYGANGARRLIKGLTSRVDKMVVPACECGSCPFCCNVDETEDCE